MLGSARAAGISVSLYIEDATTSVWDTDPTKVGVTLQIGNNGTAPADDVRVTSITLRGGAFSGPTPLPIPIGRIEAQGTVLLDLVIAVPRTDGTAYPLTIRGTYTYWGRSHDFSINREVSPNSGAPGPVSAQGGVTAKGSTALQSRMPSPPASPPSVGPNATTPMMIPLGPPRQLFIAKPDKNE